MSFSLEQFYQLNRRALIWGALLGLLWLLRDFFGLIFLTFLLAFFALALVRAVTTRLRLSYLLALVGTYLVFLALLVSFVRFVTPQVIGEANRLLGNLPATEQRLVEIKDDLVRKYPGLGRSLPGYLRSSLDEEALVEIEQSLQREARRLDLGPEDLRPYAEREQAEPERRAQIARYRQFEQRVLLQSVVTAQVEKARKHFPRIVNLLYRATITLLLALLFSFLILIDLRRLRAQLRGLDRSRLHDLYEEAAQPVVRFAYVVGRAFQAQATIAVANTVLTLIGLLLLSIPSVSMLSLVVFVCSFIPVLGVFISTAPIVLVALNAGGLSLALLAVAFIVLVHAVEAYLLNPLIYGQHMKLNPVVVLIILLVGHHLFGIWGMLLGVPIAYYILHDVFGIPVSGERRPPADSGAQDA